VSRPPFTLVLFNKNYFLNFVVNYIEDRGREHAGVETRVENPVGESGGRIR
jgi:hypothetical protein